MNKKHWFLLFFLTHSYLSSLAQTPVFISDSLQAYIKRGMADWQIPGMAVAIVKDGEVIVSKGFGVLEVGKDSRVDENTLFFIASNTKLFTATDFALLDERKKLSLDDKVIKYLPDFRLADASTTQLVTIRDLLSHRIGTKNFQGDFMFWDTDLTRKDVLNRMRLLAAPNQFRQDFGYSNQGYVVASEIIPKISGMNWETFTESSLLKPLGMNRTFMLSAGADKRSNIALPYTTCCSADSKLTKLPFDNLDNLGPATGMLSSVSDLSRWMIMQLDSGRFDGKRILPWAVLEKTRVVNTLASTDKMKAFPLSYQFYCLGTGLFDYAGYYVYAHAGACSGFKSTTTLVPEKNLGIVVLTNQDNSNFHEALRFQILDAYLNVPYTNRHSYYLNRAKSKDQKSRDEIKGLTQRVEKKLKPKIPLLAYCGTYRNELYGTLSVALDTVKGRSGLTIHFEHHQSLIAQLDYMDGEEFRLTFSNPRFGIFPVSFTKANNQVESLEIKGTDFVDHDSYEFKKMNE
ncbi:serine hydrolase [Spirosoma pollinicola]|uniref:Serine hydrolase n=1 Tax=Spirosoma pollinicola TaxID=2057025 RepID=A0A2K8Z2S3_9BACT|nr:serine hydrolase [Spirosoma pollinicola]AUD04178.1 serine hydrolase [Spirosoma pollinicola]